MPKQVRLRRGTTAQHATFVGADGEVTFDTSKKCLVVHDGVTAGGTPIEGWLRRIARFPFDVDESDVLLWLKGGDDFLDGQPGLNVDYLANFNGPAEFRGQVRLQSLLQTVNPMVYAAGVSLDLRYGSFYTLDLAGDCVFNASAYGEGTTTQVRVKADGTTRTLVFPSGWVWVGSAAPATIAAGKTALLTLRCFGTDATAVVAQWQVQP